MLVKIKWLGEPTRIAPKNNGAKIDVGTGETIEVDVDQARQLLKSYKQKIKLLGELNQDAPAAFKGFIDAIGSLTNNELKKAKQACEKQLVKNEKNGVGEEPEVEKTDEAILIARKQYEELIGDVPNNKKNDIEWLNSKCAEKIAE